jgi:hypothetical protein
MTGGDFSRIFAKEIVVNIEAAANVCFFPLQTALYFLYSNVVSPQPSSITTLSSETFLYRNVVSNLRHISVTKSQQHVANKNSRQPNIFIRKGLAVFCAFETAKF